MKPFKKILIAIAICYSSALFAQAPQKISYQAVIRNPDNTLVVNSPVGIRISILRSSFNGAAAYVERQLATTNTNGLVSLEIGNGLVISGDFTTISWGTASYFIKTEIDPTGGSNYSITMSSQFLSVPYALYAETSGNTGPAGPQGIAGEAGAPGANGMDGTNGLSAYEIWLAAGNVGSQTDFLSSLVGAQGATGNDGATGPAGPQGAAGTDGTTGVLAFIEYYNSSVVSVSPSSPLLFATAGQTSGEILYANGGFTLPDAGTYQVNYRGFSQLSAGSVSSYVDNVAVQTLPIPIFSGQVTGTFLIKTTTTNSVLTLVNTGMVSIPFTSSHIIITRIR